MIQIDSKEKVWGMHIADESQIAVKVKADETLDWLRSLNCNKNSKGAI